MALNKKWNWQQDDWPHFTYDPNILSSFEQEFLSKSGETLGISKHFSGDEKRDLTIEFMSNEAFNTSEIEGEVLDRQSLQSSIKRHFGLHETPLRNRPAEEGIAEMMSDLYYHYQTPLTHEEIWRWHEMLMRGRRDLTHIGAYRSHEEPMEIISNSLMNPRVHFEAPPSKIVKKEMDSFIDWFNRTAPEGKKPLPALLRSGIAHLYFETIHPFEDGNGRIGRALVEKILAQNLKRPTLIALSQIIKEKRKAYYDALEKQNHHNQINDWLIYFAETILVAQQYTIDQFEFLIKKSNFIHKYKDMMNERQFKAVERILKEGPKGFEGGLSAKNYMTITQTSASTATRDLHDLVEKKIFLQKGILKATRYWINLP